MKEISQLIKELKRYPPNWFVHPLVEPDDRQGLVVSTVDKEEKDFIDLGDRDTIIL